MTSDRPHPLCYCFGHTLASIRRELRETGRTTVVASIEEKVRARQCRCAELHPLGICCLRDVRETVARELEDARKGG